MNLSPGPCRRLHAADGEQRWRSIPAFSSVFPMTRSGFCADHPAGVVAEYPGGASVAAGQDSEGPDSAAKSRPGQISYASAGAGRHTPCRRMFKIMAGVDGACALQNWRRRDPGICWAAGCATFATLPSVMPYVKAGRLRAVADHQPALARAPGCADVAESGFRASKSAPGSGCWLQRHAKSSASCDEVVK